MGQGGAVYDPDDRQIECGAVVNRLELGVHVGTADEMC